jgi:hypothetical protein
VEKPEVSIVEDSTEAEVEDAHVAVAPKASLLRPGETNEGFLARAIVHTHRHTFTNTTLMSQ